jgi:hypothetical protein
MTFRLRLPVLMRGLVALVGLGLVAAGFLVATHVPAQYHLRVPEVSASRSDPTTSSHTHRITVVVVRVERRESVQLLVRHQRHELAIGLARCVKPRTTPTAA